MQIRILTLALLSLFGCVLPAAADQVDDYIRERMQKRHIPGLSLAVIKDGQVALARGYGLANVELDVPATPETVYPLYSVTKTFTATAVMMLVEEGKLALDDRVRQHLPKLPEAWDAVTVRQLLNHTSGIKSFTSVVENFKLFRLDYTPEEVVRTVAEFPLDFTPGEKFAYNNTGYFLLGMLIEQAGGKPYADFMRERIFEPLRMTSTRLNDPAAIIKHRADGYRLEGSEVRNAEFASATWPFSAGSIVSTVQDMTKWDAALDGDKLLKASTLDEMWTPTKLPDGKTENYGYGWQTAKLRGHTIVMHGGGFHGFASTFNRFSDDRVTVVVLCNLEGGNPGSLANGVAEFFIPGLKEQVVVTPVEDKDPEATRKAKELFTAALAGKANPDDFAPAAREVLPDRIKQAAVALAALGEVKNFALLDRKQQDQLAVSRYRVEFDDESLVLTVSLTADGKIAGLLLQPE